MLECRAELLHRCADPLPEYCGLPKHWRVMVETDQTHCERCGQGLRRQWRRTRFPIGLALGQPELIHRHKQCPVCKQVYGCEKMAELVPAHSNYAYDLIVEVGLARFRSHLQAHEIQDRLESRFGLHVPLTTVAHLGDRFLKGFAGVHEAFASELKDWFHHHRGGYVLHLDGTCEAGTCVVFVAVDGESQLTLFAAKIPSENPDDIKAFLTKCVGLFGRPLATVRDLSEHIRLARDAVLKGVPDFVCEYHLLANIGLRLCQKHRQALSTRLRHHGLRAHLTATRQSLKSRSKGQEPIPAQAYEAFLRDPTQGLDAPLTHVRRLLVFTLIRWIEDCVVELRGEYFPFDQPELVFYRRCREMFDWLDRFLRSCKLKPAATRPLRSLRAALAPTREDSEMGAAAHRLQSAFASFQELRTTLRLHSPDRASLLRQHAPEALTVAQARQHDHDLKKYRRALDVAMKDKRHPEGADDATIVAKQLDKYWDRLLARVITPPGAHTPVVVKRTNGPSEHKFARQKRHWRRQSGNKKLRKRLQACDAAELLLDNLRNETYIEIVYDGSLDHMAQRFAEHWPDMGERDPQELAKANVEKNDPARACPLHVRKQILRSPDFLRMIASALSTLGQ